MLAKPVSGARICLKCYPYLYAQTSSLGFSSVASALRFGGSRRQQHSKASKSQDISSGEHQNVKESKWEYVVPKPPIPLRADGGLSLGRRDGFSGKHLNEERYGLDVQALGKESEIIVLKESRIRFTSRAGIDDLQQPEPVDILARVDGERGLPTLSEVEKNIEGLKPKNSKCLNWKEFRALKTVLSDGFSGSQLEKYIMPRRVKLRHRDYDRIGEQTPSDTLSPISRISPWMPGVSDSITSFDESPLRGYNSEIFKRKHRIVLDILRRSWQLEVLEVNEGIGEVEIKLCDIELELLINGSNSPLKKISEMLVSGSNENIEVFRSRNIVRVTCSKHKCNNIVQEIQRVLRTTCHLEVDISILNQCATASITKKKPEIIDHEVITELSRVTETRITKSWNGKLRISCIDEDTDTNLSTRADAARRLLLTSSITSDRSIKELHQPNHRNPLIAVTFQPSDALPWYYRSKEWARWISPTARGSSLSTPSSRASQDQIIPTSKRGLDEFMKSLRTPLSFPSPMEGKDRGPDTPRPRLWEETYSRDTCVVVGHVLHGVSDSKKASIIRKGKATVEDSTFVPAAPNLSRLLRSWDRQNDVPEESLVIRLIPSPWTLAGPETLQQFPPVEICLSIDPDTKDPKIGGVKAVVDLVESNIMLPDRTVDLQFRRRTVSCFSPESLLKAPQIEEFIRSSQLNLFRGNLKTPPSLTLPIARHIASSHAQAPQSELVPNNMDVEYLFAGLEFRSKLTFEFEGLHLLYTSVECGKADGRRGELSLHDQRLKSDHTNPSTLATPDFMEYAYRLVEALEAAQSKVEK